MQTDSLKSPNVTNQLSMNRLKLSPANSDVQSIMLKIEEFIANSLENNFTKSNTDLQENYKPIADNLAAIVKSNKSKSIDFFKPVVI